MQNRSNQTPVIILLLFLLMTLVACAPGDFDESFDPELDEFDEAYVDDEEFLEPEEPEPSDPDARSVVVDAVDVEEESENNTPQTSDQTAPFTTASCPFDGGNAYDVECGWLTVPENRQSGNGETIELAIAILPAANGSSKPPVIYLEGGPGGSALSSFESDIDGWAQYGFAQNRDLIFIDQRGTGYSIPSLNCTELDDESADVDSATEACHARLTAAGIDLAAYNSRENGSDVAALANALGYTQYSLYGVSYGTRLALAVMRDHPEGIEKVVLDSPFPPHVDPGETESVITYGRIQALFQTCEDDQACDDAFPDLNDVFLDTVFDLNDNPAEGGEVTGDFLVETIYQALFAGEDVNFLVPLMIYDASEGNFDLLFELQEEASLSQDLNHLGSLRQSPSENDGDSEGMYHSVMCHDEFSFSNFTEAETNLMDQVPAEVGDGLFVSTLDQFNTCDLWDVEATSDDINEPVQSDIPTLILVGEFDPATPPEWGEETDRFLSNSVLYELPGSGHSVTSANFCAIAMMDSFFESDSHTVDASCLDDIRPIEFELP